MFWLGFGVWFVLVVLGILFCDEYFVVCEVVLNVLVVLGIDVVGFEKIVGLLFGDIDWFVVLVVVKVLGMFGIKMVVVFLCKFVVSFDL